MKKNLKTPSNNNSILRIWWVRIVLRGFDLLYHNFAWVYDFAAWLVSAGKWNDWIHTAGWLAQPGTLLDLGCGKGILLEQATSRGFFAVGLDESPQMLRNARRLLSPTPHHLVRGLGQTLPIKTGTFLTVTATFPAPYIFDTATLNEVRRVLLPGGKLVILLTADVTGTSLHEFLIRFFSRFAGFGHVSPAFQEYYQQPMRECGFLCHSEWIGTPGGRLFVIIAQPV